MFQLDKSENAKVQPTILWNPKFEDQTSYIRLINMDGNKGAIFEKQWKNWSWYLNEEEREGLIAAVTEPKEVHIDIKVLALNFSKLKDTAEIESFSKNYGLLGLLAPPIVESVQSPPFLDKSLIFKKSMYGSCYYEPLLLWKWHTKNVRCLLRLYNALKKENSGNEIEIEDSILRVQPISRSVNDININISDEYGVFWADGEFTNIEISSPEERSFKELGERVLVDGISRWIEEGVNLYAKDIIKDETKDVGFRIPERRRTSYLLVAIYYGLWQLVNNSAKIEICDNPNCRQPFEKIGRGKHCKPACKQAAYRARKQQNMDHL
jgi:hypothetical protein